MFRGGNRSNHPGESCIEDHLMAALENVIQYLCMLWCIKKLHPIHAELCFHQIDPRTRLHKATIAPNSQIRQYSE